MIKIVLSIIFIWVLTIKNINAQLLAKADKIEKQENGLTKYTDSFNNFVWYASESIIVNDVGIRIVGMFRKNLLTPGLLDPKLVNGNTLYLWIEFSFEEKKYVKNITILYDNNYKDVVFDSNDSNIAKYNYRKLLYI